MPCDGRDMIGRLLVRQSGDDQPMLDRQTDDDLSNAHHTDLPSSAEQFRARPSSIRRIRKLIICVRFFLCKPSSMEARPQKQISSLDVQSLGTNAIFAGTKFHQSPPSEPSAYATNSS